MVGRWIAWISASVLVVGCAEIEVSDCDGIDGRSDCEDADVDFGQCRWVDVYKPVVDASSCDLGEPVGLCVGLPDSTSQGCGGTSCPDGGGVSVYQRMAGGLPELFINPECGPVPHGDWQLCEGPACACLCDVDDG